MGAGAPMLLHDVATSIMRHTTSFGPWDFMRFLCLRHVPLLRGLDNVPRRDSTLVNTYLDKVARDVNIMPRSIMLKGSRGRRVSELSCAFLCLFNFASFDNCGQSSSWFGMTAPFMTEKQTLFPIACVCGAALRTSGPPWSNTSLPGGEARVILWYKWNRDTCLLTRWRQGLSVNGGCLLPQLALPPHLALITAGCSE